MCESRLNNWSGVKRDVEVSWLVLVATKQVDQHTREQSRGGPKTHQVDVCNRTCIQFRLNFFSILGIVREVFMHFWPISEVVHVSAFKS